jgi:dihydroxyacetone kinase DhaKLM complex PTS-EIIA-like component DhaM
MAEVTNAKAAVFNFFNIGSALLNAMMLCQLVKAINDFNELVHFRKRIGVEGFNLIFKMSVATSPRV